MAEVGDTAQIAGGRNVSRCLAWPVADTMLIVRPWKLPFVDTTVSRPVTFRASLTAASSAH